MPNLLARLRRHPTGRFVPLSSSALAGGAYFPRQRRLELEFTSGSRYAYGCVEPETWRGLLDAPSQGRFFQAQVRDRHPFLRLDAAQR